MIRPRSRLLRLFEAGLQNAPTGKVKSKWRKFASAEEPGDDDEYDPAELPDEEPEPEPERPAPPPPKPREPETPMFGKSAKPSPALQGGKTAGGVKADPATLEALMRALEKVRSGDDDLMDWVDDVVREIRRVVRTGGELTLPKFEATPSDLEDDEAGSEDEDY